MWVSYPSYEFLTIRNHSKMTLIYPTYDASTDTLTVTAPAPDTIDEKLEFSIPAHPTPAYLAANTSIHDVNIWKQWTPAHVFAPELTASFNAFFGHEVRLVYKPPQSTDLAPRPLRSNGAPHLLGRDASTCFPDMMPLLIGSESSLAELNGRLEGAGESAIHVRRFRPNVLVKGDADAPWDEDRWKTVKLGDGKESITLDVTQRCARCRVPNVEPDTAVQHKTQPWDTLMKYRRVDEGIKFKPCYGMLCVPQQTGEVRVGMRVEVTKVTTEHRYIAGF
jgi:uncharacterized protein YcbX